MDSQANRRLITIRNHLRTLPNEFGIKRCPCKVISASEAAQLVPSNAAITISGFVGSGHPELLVNAVRERFEQCGQPRNLHVFNVAAVGDGKGRGLGKLATKGLVTRYTFAWSGLSQEFLQLAKEGAITAWNLPLGVMAHLLRDVAARRPGPITKIGLGTFVDPREQGGKLNGPSQADAVEVVSLGGEEYLWYKAPAKIDVALLRGTTADLHGNVSFERESLLTDALNQAMAAHNSGGLVIVQVERLVAPGTLHARLVHLPGAIVDKIVVAPAELHRQTITMAGHDASLTGEIRAPASHIQPMPLDERRIIGHRAMLEISRPHCIVNLGIGMPEGVARMVATHGQAQIPHALPAHLTTEAGMFGGFPAGSASFGAAHNADCIVPCATMLDFYNGGGVDMACLGAAEVDQEGNVNVHSFPGRQPGCGGFIDISQAAKEVIFAGTFTTGGLKVAVEDGKLRIIQEGRSRKFKRRVSEKTFAASSAKGRRILYVTERAVFRLREGEGIELTEIAPGIDLERDILAYMPFRPLMKDVKVMDKRCFML
ncbi:hypothetical protein WJX75_007599 [Coccomyxa subellipsoidea]|uniref:Succinyl-CoA:3-ketoacid-coenzyme A transferase n=1 Tax=Coccomyxa subellipsoidea TaxID=248742 RepID=A0ABR2YRS7_9CHLO